MFYTYLTFFSFFLISMYIYLFQMRGLDLGI